MFYQDIISQETGNVNVFWLISEFLRNLEKSQSKNHHYSEVFQQIFSQNKPWGVLSWQLFCLTLQQWVCFFSPKVFYTQVVTNILLFHLKGRFQSTFVNIQTITRFLQWCTRELTDQSQSLEKHNKNTPIKTAQQINPMNSIP